MVEASGKNARAMVRRLSHPFAVLVLLGLAAPARAADAETGTVVLGIEALDPQDNGVANDITEALRQRVATSKGGPLMPGKDLVEIKLVFSCSDEAPACLAQAAKSLGAAKLIYGNVKRAGGELVITLKQVDATRGVLDGSTVETIAKRKGEPAALRALSSQWLAKLNGKGGGNAGPTGTLVVRSNVAGAVISLDGAEVGVTGRRALSIQDVPAGKHEISVAKAGFATTSQEFTLGASQALPLMLTLPGGGAPLPEGGAEGTGEGAGGPPPRSARRDEGPADDATRTWERRGFWVAMGLAAVSFGVATKYGLDVRSINSDLDHFRNVSPLSDSQQTTIHDKLDEGNRAVTRQWIFIGVGTAFAAAGGFLLYKGYLDKEAGSGPKTSDNRGLRVFPTANTSSGGIAAEFDF
jgi:hypothetical protein